MADNDGNLIKILLVFTCRRVHETAFITSAYTAVSLMAEPRWTCTPLTSTRPHASRSTSRTCGAVTQISGLAHSDTNCLGSFLSIFFLIICLSTYLSIFFLNLFLLIYLYTISLISFYQSIYQPLSHTSIIGRIRQKIKAKKGYQCLSLL